MAAKATWNEAEIFRVDCCEFATETADESCVGAVFYRFVGIGDRGHIRADCAGRSCRQLSEKDFVAAGYVAPRHLKAIYDTGRMAALVRSVRYRSGWGTREPRCLTSRWMHGI